MWWRPSDRVWWTGVGFAVGSLCFAVAAMASQWASAPRPAIGVTFFAGSLLFTAAAALQLRGAARGERAACVIQFAGTLLFNLSTFEAMKRGLDARQTDLRVWSPDAAGSV